MAQRSYRARHHQESVQRTVAGVRRAWRKRRRGLVRQAAQLRAAQQDQQQNLQAALQLREHNVQMGMKGQEILNMTRSRREKMVQAQVAAARRQQRLLLASLSASLLLLGYSAWSVLR